MECQSRLGKCISSSPSVGIYGGIFSLVSLSLIDQSNTDAMSMDTPLSEITMIPAPMTVVDKGKKGTFLAFSFFTLSNRSS